MKELPSHLVSEDFYIWFNIKEKEEYYLYRNKYKCGDKKIELSHLFYNLSDVIDN